jgi:hypothetical protein
MEDGQGRRLLSTVLLIQDFLASLLRLVVFLERERELLDQSSSQIVEGTVG